MPESPEELQSRIFIAEQILPSAKEAFFASIDPIDQAIKDAEVVLDNNILLIPYGATAENLKEIIELYSKLKTEKRLHLPAQVIREFIKNRTLKIAELHQGMVDKISQMQVPDAFTYPILEHTDGYHELNGLLKSAKELKKEITTKNRDLLERIRAWQIDDPVYSEYKRVFTEDIIIEVTEDRLDIQKQLFERYERKIPPGYKDADKPDNGIGDLLIWLSILSIGRLKKNNLIFVTGEEKADWQHRSNNTGLLPRYELLDEYRRASSGKGFYILPLSKLLELMKTDPALVANIKQEETRSVQVNITTVYCPYCESAVSMNLPDHLGAATMPTCINCNQKFAVERVTGGISINPIAQRPTRDLGSQVELVACPVCGGRNDVDLGLAPNSTKWTICPNCVTRFPTHRLLDGRFKVGSAQGRSRYDIS